MQATLFERDEIKTTNMCNIITHRRCTKIIISIKKTKYKYIAEIKELKIITFLINREIYIDLIWDIFFDTDSICVTFCKKFHCIDIVFGNCYLECT